MQVEQIDLFGNRVPIPQSATETSSEDLFIYRCWSACATSWRLTEREVARKPTMRCPECGGPMVLMETVKVAVSEEEVV